MQKAKITTTRLQREHGLKKDEEYEIVSKSQDGKFTYVKNLKYNPARSDVSAQWVALDKDDCIEVTVEEEAVVD